MNMITQGSLIEYIDAGEFNCALVTETSGNRLRLLAQNGRELNLSKSRIVSVSRQKFSVDGGREHLVTLLKETAQHRRQLAASINLKEIWELASAEPVTEFSVLFLAELQFGDEVTDDQAAAFLRATVADRFYFKFKNGRITVYTPEQVEQLQHQAQKEAEKKKILETGSVTLKRIMDGEDISPEQWPERELILQWLENYYLYGNDFHEFDLVRQLLKKAGLTGPHDSYRILRRTKIWRKDENIPLLRSGHPTQFTPEISSKADKIQPITLEELLADPKRQDFRHLPTMTIDGPDTLDFDDALHIEKLDNGFRVGIHIADVTQYVSPDDPIFIEAAERGTSLYFPEGQVPMLPKSLGHDSCSLLQDEVRPVISILLQLDNTGNIIRAKIVPAIIQVHRRLTYSAVDEMLETDEEISTLHKLSHSLRVGRLKKGALFLPVPDVQIELTEGNEVSIALSPVDTPSRSLVAEFMIQANIAAAEYMASQEAPGLFRAQGSPRKRIVSSLNDGLFPVVHQRRFLSRGELLTHSKEHSGLGASCYTTITSPIRRFLDLAMQHQLNSLIRGKGMLFSESECRKFVAQVNQSLGRAATIRQQRHRYWMLRFLEKKEGQKMNALVVYKGPKRISMMLTNCLFEFDLSLNPSFQVLPGDMISVKIARVNALDNRLRIEW